MYVLQDHFSMPGHSRHPNQIWMMYLLGTVCVPPPKQCTPCSIFSLIVPFQSIRDHCHVRVVNDYADIDFPDISEYADLSKSKNYDKPLSLLINGSVIHIQQFQIGQIKKGIKSRDTIPLKGQCHQIFWHFFHELNPPRPLINRLKWFC